MKKMKKQGGFTLVEMLIVVAIIAILVAVSIPLVNSSLDKAQKATDDANIRAAKAAATIMYMNNKMDSSLTAPTVGMKYDNVKGTFVGSGETLTESNYGQESGHTYIVIKAVNAGTGGEEVVSVGWN